MSPKVLPRCPTRPVSVLTTALIWFGNKRHLMPYWITLWVMDCKFACHVTRIPRQEIHLIPILEVDEGTCLRVSSLVLNYSTLCNLSFQQWVCVPLCSSYCRVHKGMILGKHWFYRTTSFALWYCYTLCVCCSGSQKITTFDGNRSHTTCFKGKCDRTHITCFQGNWDVRCTIGATLLWYNFSNKQEVE